MIETNVINHPIFILIAFWKGLLYKKQFDRLELLNSMIH